MKIAYGFVLLIVVIAGCFGYQVYLISQLQSQVNTLQDQNNEIIRPKIIVLSYSWTDEQYSGSLYMISVNCTLFNASPKDAYSSGVFIKALFGNNHTEEEGYGAEFDFGAWQTRNYYDLNLIYDRVQLGLVENIWLEPHWIG